MASKAVSMDTAAGIAAARSSVRSKQRFCLLTDALLPRSITYLSVSTEHTVAQTHVNLADDFVAQRLPILNSYPNH